MRNTEHLGLVLYDASDKMNITGADNSLNHNMELLDAEVARKLDAPEGGVSGQVMTRTEGGVAWADAPDGGNADGAVLYTEQALDEAQQAVARANIGAAEAAELNSLSQSAASMGTEIDTLDAIINGRAYVERHEVQISATENKSISGTVFDVDIKAGEAYTVTMVQDGIILDGRGLSLYEVEADGTNKNVGILKESTGWTISANATLETKHFKIYIGGDGVAGSGTVTLRLEIPRTQNGAFAQRLDRLEADSVHRKTDNHFMLYTDTVLRGQDGTISAYDNWITTELVSLLENLSLLGLDVPLLRTILDVAQGGEVRTEDRRQSAESGKEDN